MRCIIIICAALLPTKHVCIPLFCFYVLKKLFIQTSKHPECTLRFHLMFFLMFVFSLKKVLQFVAFGFGAHFLNFCAFAFLCVLSFRATVRIHSLYSTKIKVWGSEWIFGHRKHRTLTLETRFCVLPPTCCYIEASKTIGAY